jgi:hypothetical protein
MSEGIDPLSDRHALYVGWAMGIARSHELPVRPVTTEAGDYTAHLVIETPHGSIVVVVPEPPPGWTPTDG